MRVGQFDFLFVLNQLNMNTFSGCFICSTSQTKYFRPPPLCGAVSADNNYVAKSSNKVAARVKGQDGEENWILAEVVSYNSSSNKYEVDDIDAEEGKE